MVLPLLIRYNLYSMIKMFVFIDSVYFYTIFMVRLLASLPTSLLD